MPSSSRSTAVWRVIVKNGPHFPVNINPWAIQWAQQIQTCGRLSLYILHAAAPTLHRTVGVGVLAHISIIQILPWFFPTCTRAHADLVLTLFWGPQASDASDRYLFIIHSWENLRERKDKSGYTSFDFARTNKSLYPRCRLVMVKILSRLLSRVIIIGCNWNSSGTPVSSLPSEFFL